MIQTSFITKMSNISPNVLLKTSMSCQKPRGNEIWRRTCKRDFAQADRRKDTARFFPRVKKQQAATNKTFTRCLTLTDIVKYIFLTMKMRVEWSLQSVKNDNVRCGVNKVIKQKHFAQIFLVQISTLSELQSRSQ